MAQAQATNNRSTCHNHIQTLKNRSHIIPIDVQISYSVPMKECLWVKKVRLAQTNPNLLLSFTCTRAGPLQSIPWTVNDPLNGAVYLLHRVIPLRVRRINEGCLTTINGVLLTSNKGKIWPFDRWLQRPTYIQLYCRHLANCRKMRQAI